jgi:hypothetical protein
MIYLLQFLCSFVAVFLKGFQHQNVIGGKYKSAFIFSYLMAATNVIVIGLVVEGGLMSIVPVGTGAAIGITLSMYMYRKINGNGE